LTSPNDCGSSYVDASCGRADPMKRCVAETRSYCILLFSHGPGSRVRTLESDLMEGGVVTGKLSTLGETKGHQHTREHQHTIQQTNHCTPLSSALGKRLQIGGIKKPS